MAFITPTAEVVEVGGGVFRNTIHLAPVAYQDASGNLQAISDQWNDGDATYPHVISAARLRVRAAPNGDRLLLPVPGDDEAWFSISSPFINNGTNWIQPSLGSFSRSGNQLTATAANVITRINHAGHYIKAEYELLNGWTPANGQFAYRVGLQGLTRQGGTLLYNGVPVMQLRKPVAYDADNESDVREITHDFVQLGGNTYILFTLPSLAGMSRPVVDPTFTAQPDGTAGKDATITARAATTNYGSIVTNNVGDLNIGAPADRTLIQFDLSSIPSGATVSSATLSMWIATDYANNSGTHAAYRLKRAWVESEATWNIYSTGNNWQTAGGFGANDCEQTDIGSVAVTASESAGTEKQWSLTASAVEQWISGAFTNNGLLIKSTAESDDGYLYDSSDGTTAAERPKLVVEWTYSNVWWTGNGTVTGCTNAWQAYGSTSESLSYTDLVGSHTLSEVGSTGVTWNADSGWYSAFGNGGLLAATPETAQANRSLIMEVYIPSGSGQLCGVWNGREYGLSFNGTNVVYANGGSAATGSATITTGTRYILAIAGNKGYINGVEDATGMSETGSLTGYGMGLFLRNTAGSYGGGINGLYGRAFAMYNRTLTASEVAQITSDLQSVWAPDTTIPVVMQQYRRRRGI